MHSLRKTVGKAPPILVTLTSRSDSDVKSSNVSLKENKPDGVNPNSNDTDYQVRENEGKILWFSGDCMLRLSPHTLSHLRSFMEPMSFREGLVTHFQ